ncbi:hypothetical protein L1987_42658 [Smallanthus sonchifolius]|uniref:Uncharacterized protein n=1 Tax=Smallanthus sonchifolius TaxID=185202 RepID=A0ACB9GJH3_9ASTR|nr:hypothetical protein L1987_42658 [Smallanthus sonchifolius]
MARVVTRGCREPRWRASGSRWFGGVAVMDKPRGRGREKIANGCQWWFPAAQGGEGGGVRFLERKRGGHLGFLFQCVQGLLRTITSFQGGGGGGS